MIFKVDIVHVMSAPNHTRTDARIMIFKLFKGLLKWIIEKNNFMYTSKPITFADLMLTIYLMWKKSLNIEIH